MSPEPSTNDYLADILSQLTRARELLEAQREENKTEMGYAVFQADTNSQLTDWTSETNAITASHMYTERTGIPTAVVSAEEEHERKLAQRG